MRVPSQNRRPRKSQLHSFPAPTAGLISNRALAMAEDGPPGAAVMRNFFPTPTGAILRRGLAEVADLTDPIESLFSYTDGANTSLFAATEDTIYDLSGANPAIAKSGYTGGKWSVVQFATAGGVFLLGVNGEDDAFIYDGTGFSDASLTFSSGSLTMGDLSFVWVYKQRLWFIEKNSLNAWYLPVDSVAGALDLWPMGGVFVDGGTLQWGQGWSLDSGSAGGLSEQCVFTTTEGEVAAYQGLSPEPDGNGLTSWFKVGTYRIGKPLGDRAFTRAGGDLLIATSVGLISLAAASQLDRAALGQNAVSYPVDVTWADLVRLRGLDGWQCIVWAEAHILMVVPSRLSNDQPNEVLVANTNTGAWAVFTGWHCGAAHVFNGVMFLGHEGGEVSRAWTGGNDMGARYVGALAPLFTTTDAPASRKFPKLARASYLSASKVDEKLTAMFDYLPVFDSVPSDTGEDFPNVWGTGVWGDMTWGETAERKLTAEWRGVRGSGNVVSVGVQVTSTEDAPRDIEIVSLDMIYQTGDLVT